MTLVTRDISITTEFKTSLKDYAWGERKHVSAVVREQIERYAEAVPGEVVESEPLSARVRFTVDEEVWAKAQARAKSEGISLSEAVRNLLASHLTGGYNPADDA